MASNLCWSVRSIRYVHGDPIRYRDIVLTSGLGGVLFGYDTGTIGGILAMPYWLKTFSTGYTVDGAPAITSSQSSMIVSILVSSVLLSRSMIKPNNVTVRWYLLRRSHSSTHRRLLRPSLWIDGHHDRVLCRRYSPDYCNRYSGVHSGSLLRWLRRRNGLRFDPTVPVRDCT
jgi:hypothetical protein